jgi:hypothetical protein
VNRSSGHLPLGLAAEREALQAWALANFKEAYRVMADASNGVSSAFFLRPPGSAIFRIHSVITPIRVIKKISLFTLIKKTDSFAPGLETYTGFVAAAGCHRALDTQSTPGRNHGEPDQPDHSSGGSGLEISLPGRFE